MNILNSLKESDINNLKSKIKVLDDYSCWLWTASVDEWGYGRFAFGPKNNRKKIQAHRISYIIHNNVDIPDGKIVRHTCDIPACCNPNHLILGTHQDNMNDMKERGRSAICFGAAKLTWEIVDEIRNSSLSRKELITKYGIAKSTLSMILNNKIWLEEHRHICKGLL